MTLWWRYAVLLAVLHCAWAQSDTENDPTNNSDDGNDDNDTCTFISGQSCTANGICKYCAMCLQSSCILSKTAVTANLDQNSGVCNTTQQGATNVYSWFNYCLSSGEDNSGDYCATSTECYQYRKSVNPTVSNVWQNLTCNPTSCLLVTNNGQPAPLPGQLAPASSPGGSNTSLSGSPIDAGGGQSGQHYHGGMHSPIVIALTVTCSFVFMAGVVWLVRLWLQYRRRRQQQDGAGASCHRIPSTSSRQSTPSTAPPSFRSTPDMTQVNPSSTTTAAVFGASAVAAAAAASRATNPSAAAAVTSTSLTDQHESRSSSVRSSSSITSHGHQPEPLPSYYSPDPSPPKYELAIVTQIRGLLDDQEEMETSPTESLTSEHANGLPPPMWLPVYFTPNNHTAIFGRLRRHPPYPSSLPSSTSTRTSDMTDPMRAFWYHHNSLQQQQRHFTLPSPSLPVAASANTTGDVSGATSDSPFASPADIHADAVNAVAAAASPEVADADPVSGTHDDQLSPQSHRHTDGTDPPHST